MSNSSLIAQNVPYLRRFARALTGSQESGDSYAVAALDVIADAPEMPSNNAAAKCYLFRVFHSIWSSMPLNYRIETDATEPLAAAADRTLESIPPLPKVAFLLRAVENFTTVEIAEIMGVSEEEVTALLADASREVAAHLSTDVLIIEDEQIISMDLKTLVEELGHRVVEIARTRQEAIDAVSTRAPGLVLADIQLADGSSGLDAVNDILRDSSVPVIFITAFPERLLTGARPEPTFLITKPFRRETVIAIINQALFFDRRAAIAGS